MGPYFSMKLKFTIKSCYAIRAMMYIAAHSAKGERCLLKDISAGEKISLKFLGHILSALRKGNLVKSSRDRVSGYTLKRAASDITIKDIIEAVEGSLSSAERIENFALWEALTEIPAQEMIENLLRTIDPVLTATTLQSLLAAKSILLCEKPCAS